MLKALELVGFKSFAEKTRFEFPDGITVIVGPNGSGKSNVVDAIKWVLGAQSAKALRGQDMADVIFKGAATGGRKPANSAEATLVFDNSQNSFPVDTPEVHVTRRVYRSGEGEYLINGQPCRLKDIKDLFRGTGVGVDAYSLIEQGKVDRMLQASAKDRRIIFEEAAGISRYKAKRVEAERRLQRVEQNLLRLSDLVREMDERLQRLQSQASKAQRYRAMNERLQTLRTQMAVADWTAIVAQCNKAQQELESLRQDEANLSQSLQNCLTRIQATELEMHEIGREASTVEQSLRGTQQSLVEVNSQQRLYWQRRQECDEEISRIRNRLMALRQKADLAQVQVAQMHEEVVQARTAVAQARQKSDRAAHELQDVESNAQNYQKQLDSTRKRYLDHLHEASQQNILISGQESKLAELQKILSGLQRKLEKADLNEQEAQLEAQQADTKLQELSLGAEEAQQLFEAAQHQLDEARKVLSRRQEDAAALQGRLEGARERLVVLEELDRQQDGVGLGTKRLLQLSKEENVAPWNSIRGLVAEMIEVDIHLAPLVDVSLGGMSQAIVLSDAQLLNAVRDGDLQVDGKVTLLRLDRIPTRRMGDRIQLDGLRGVIGRADRLVHYAPEYETLMRHLLGTTWFVDTLATALDLNHFRGAGLRFVTAAGQLIDSDGTVTLGAAQATLGLVARRSEMLAARNEIQHYSYQLRTAHQEIERLQDNIDQTARQLRRLDQANRARQEARAQQKLVADSARFRLQQLESVRRTAHHEVNEATEQQQFVMDALRTAQSEQARLQLLVVELESLLQAAQDGAQGLETERKKLQQVALDRRVEMAKCEQRLDHLESILKQVTRDQDERQQAVSEVRQQLIDHESKTKQIDLQILDLTSQFAYLSQAKERLGDQLATLAQGAQTIRTRRQTEQKEKESFERKQNKLNDQLGRMTSELERHQMNGVQLRQRMQEDYGLDLGDEGLMTNTEPLDDRLKAEEEAGRLRQDIASVGAVNMEALHELDQEQQRYDELNGQYTDLKNAKEGLEKIIQRIDQDSRRLFQETLEAIRTNFQMLYRKSFGGGNADLILVEGNEEREPGVEIIATPPGKTALSNSLLSGGEKALTAVALLLAIFQFRPSPFCVLDEVDAPFDEANIGRFVKVLEEFLDSTKFIVVTHSKKTMTAATTLYGVTMEESGVSKKVAVRFEEVGDDGEILSAPSKNSARRAA
jgi:chromosome segregation protein